MIITSKVIYLVIPCFNEEEVLFETAQQLKQFVKNMMQKGKVSEKSRIVFVNDGSKDNTWELIESLHKADALFQGIKLAHNQGHQKALLAGLMSVKDYADAVISLDADLQDDIGVMEQFVDRFNEGCDIVYGVRNSRKTDTLFKKGTARLFYKLMKFMGVDLIEDHADYRLMSKRALEGMAEFKEVNLFLRGMVPMIGYKTARVEYERKERFAGESKYPLKRMISFAIDGITSFSIRPIHFITALGFMIFLVSLILTAYFLIVYFMGRTVAGWTTIAISLWAIGGLQLLSIGIIGEYLGKVYLETKQRPRYLIETFLKDEDGE